jgi:hypothetical protein
MIWAGYVARMGDTRNTRVWSENLKERDHPEDLGVDGTVLQWILGKYNGKV